MIFEVDPESGRVNASEVHDASGNVNRMTFSDVQINKGVDAAHFHFTPPKGTTVQELSGGRLE